MSRTHKRVRLHRGGLTGEWSAVRVNQMGVITDRWPIHPDDQAVLNDRWQTAAAERDALAARLAAVEDLVAEWERVQEQNRKALGELARGTSHLLLDTPGPADFRAALAAPTDTTKEN